MCNTVFIKKGDKIWDKEMVHFILKDGDNLLMLINLARDERGYVFLFLCIFTFLYIVSVY